MISFTFPVMEIHSSKEPIAIIQFPSRKQKEYKIRALGGKYCYVKDKSFEGVFELDPTRAYYSGNTPIYYFDSRNAKPIDWVLGNELVKFAKRNGLTKIEHKDAIHSKMLRTILKDTPDLKQALRILDEKILKRKTEINDTLDEFNQKLSETPSESQPDTAAMGYMLTNYLVQKNLMTTEEKGLMDAEIARGEMTLEALIAKLRDKEIVTIREPFTRDVELYLEQFGSYNPTQLAGFVDRLRQVDKGLKTMTSVPLKSWMPAGIIMAILIGGSIAAMVLFNNMDDFGAKIGGLMPGG